MRHAAHQRQGRGFAAVAWIPALLHRQDRGKHRAAAIPARPHPRLVGARQRRADGAGRAPPRVALGGGRISLLFFHERHVPHHFRARHRSSRALTEEAGVVIRLHGHSRRRFASETDGFHRGYLHNVHQLHRPVLPLHPHLCLWVLLAKIVLKKNCQSRCLIGQYKMRKFFKKKKKKKKNKKKKKKRKQRETKMSLSFLDRKHQRQELVQLASLKQQKALSSDAEKIDEDPVQKMRDKAAREEVKKILEMEKQSRKRTHRKRQKSSKKSKSTQSHDESPEDNFHPKLLEVLICPITQEVMVDPVFAADQHTYERAAIELWLRNHTRSPLTGQEMSHSNLETNRCVKSILIRLQELYSK